MVKDNVTIPLNYGIITVNYISTKTAPQWSCFYAIKLKISLLLAFLLIHGLIQ